MPHHNEGIAHAQGSLRVELQVNLYKLCQLLHQACTDAAGYIIKEELARPPYAFDHHTEHPQGKHVEEQVRETAMHEHVRYELVNAELGRSEKVEAEYVVEIDARTALDD